MRSVYPLYFSCNSLFGQVSPAKTLFLFTLSIFYFNGWSQLTYLPLDNFFRDRAFGVTLESDSVGRYKHQVTNFGAFFPVLESRAYHLEDLESAKNRSTWFGRKLFDEHFFEHKDDEFFVTFDILSDLSLGKDLRDPDGNLVYFNTRGVQVNGGIGKYFGFYSTLRENQARFLDYQLKEIRKGGQISVNENGNYNQSGFFISGGNRAKSFQGNAQDFAYVTGGMIFQPHKKLIFNLGNNPLFIGAGHRSLFYSDHSNMFPYLRTSWLISEKLNFEMVHGQHLNMIRMTLNTFGTERLYEKKGYTLKYLNYRPIKSLQLSLFEGSTWLRYDNDNVGRVHPMYYNPIPLFHAAVLGLQAPRFNTILGIQSIWNPISSIHVYGQMASNSFERFEPALQVGLRLAEPFKIRNLHMLVEANRIPETMYRHDNPRLNYVNNNLSLAHPMGVGLDELVARMSYEWKRIAISVQTNQIRTLQNMQTGVNGILLTPIPNTNAAFHRVNIAYGQVDLMYRFNKKSNLQLFASMIYRREWFKSYEHKTLYFGFGMRTALANRYFDL